MGGRREVSSSGERAVLEKKTEEETLTTVFLLYIMRFLDRYFITISVWIIGGTHDKILMGLLAFKRFQNLLPFLSIQRRKLASSEARSRH
jgi:hypothetical protein